MTPVYAPVPLGQHCNNQAISDRDHTAAGRVNVWRNSFAAEYLPEPGSQVTVDGVPFLFPGGSAQGDNVRCAGQFVALTPSQSDWIHVLATAERRTEDVLALHFAGGWVDFEAARVSDFWAAPAWFGERLAFQTPVMHYPRHVQDGVPATMWSQRIPVTRRASLVGVRLPRNVALHMFALTLQHTPDMVAV